MTETQNQPNNEESVVIIGTRRDDVLYGSLGHNIFYGGLGNDTFIVNNRNDQIVERYGEGTDTVYTHTTYTLPNYVENLTMTGHDNIFGFGNNSDNVLIGNSGNNRLSAGRGNDVLYGGAGNDLLLAGDDDDKLYGGDGNDILRGDHGNDYLEGNEGDDVLDGGIGADVMRGGNGNDTYYVDSPNDVVIEEANGGIDTVYTGMTYRLPTHVENLTLTGSGNYFGFGNHSDNVLIGNSGNNRLIGGRGNDVLRGEAGYDLLLAGDGDDKLYGGTGNDILRGDAGNDYLDGGEGNNTLEGGSGDDTYVFRRGSGHDVISDNLGHNSIHFEGLSMKDISLTTRPSASNPALKDWVFTIRETGETLTLKEQHKTYSSVSKYKFADKEMDVAEIFKYPEHDTSEDSVTMRVLYKDGHAVTHAAERVQHLQTASLQYWENIATQKRANDIVRPSAKQAQHSIFTKDSDGDGLVDAIDRNPQEWNVSERDLRMFSSLAYESPSALHTVFKGNYWWNTQYASIAKNINDKYFSNQANVSELVGKWTLLKAGSPGGGLDYAIFGNSNKKGGWENVVVAFRGTQATSIKDVLADLKIVTGNLPEQTKYLDEIARYIDTLHAKNVYSTGHSLGGYLAEYFAAHTMQQRNDWASDFKRSSLFNPAVLNVDKASPEALKQARDMADKMAETRITDNSDTTQARPLYETNSYVIKGEWVGDGFSGKTGAGIGILLALATGGASLAAGAAGALVGAAASQVHKGLGRYPKAKVLDFKSGDVWGKHNMTSFYESDTKLEQYFSQGKRIDKHYDNLYLMDSDQDGFSDGIENKWGSSSNDAQETPYATGTSTIYTDDRPMLAVVQTEDAAGNVLSLKGVEMTAHQQGDKMAYAANGKEIDLGKNGFDWSISISGDSKGVAALHGSAADDVLKGSDGNDYLAGGLGGDTIVTGEGRDTVAFTAWDVREGKLDHLLDFNPVKDKLDLSAMRPLLNEKESQVSWADLFVRDVDTFSPDRSYLVFNSAQKNLAYRGAGAESSTEFARFYNEDAAQLTAANIIG